MSARRFQEKTEDWLGESICVECKLMRMIVFLNKFDFIEIKLRPKVVLPLLSICNYQRPHPGAARGRPGQPSGAVSDADRGARLVAIEAEGTIKQ